MTAPAKAVPMREDVTQADRDAACALLRKMGVEIGQITLHWVETSMRDHRLMHIARPDAGDEDVERVERALNNIEYEANRGNGGLVHLKRCVAVQVKEARAALAAMRKGVDRGMVERLREATTPFVKRLTDLETRGMPEGLEPLTDDDGICVSIGELRTLRAALVDIPDDTDDRAEGYARGRAHAIDDAATLALTWFDETVATLHENQVAQHISAAIRALDTEQPR